MEPNMPARERSPEQPPTPIEYGQQIERPEALSHERAAERSPEQNQEMHNATTVANAAAPVTLPAPVAPTPPVADQTATNDSAAPSTAADDDLIEKEWVDSAKKIIAATKDDPHSRERQVGKLQADYLRKRYGKELGLTE